jgi:hydroxymethylglutaryl-CoA synthase
MVEYASAAIFRHDWSKCDTVRKVLEEIGPEPKEGDYRDPAEFQAAEAGYARAFARSPLFLQAFAAKVRDTATLSRQIGNIYTGSIYLGLASLLELDRLIPGQRLGFGAYGSGCSALFFSGLVQAEAASLPRLGLMKRLEERMEISLADYEMLHEGKKERSVVEPAQEFVLDGIDSQGYRHYKFVE